MSVTASKPLAAPTVSVIIVTLNRADCMQRCLQCLREQTVAPLEVLVVDASPDDKTRNVVEQFPEFKYLRNSLGYGHMAHGRNIGLEHARGQLIAYIDDDSFAFPQWLEELVKPYSDPKVGAVGGRAIRKLDAPPNPLVHDIGTFKPHGFLGGNFDALPEGNLEVFHLPGCNMSFRSEVLAKLGGMRTTYTGTEVREETDTCARVAKLGYKCIFAPLSVVHHAGAPQSKGRRGDSRYHFYSRRNHCVFLIQNYGLRDSHLRRYLVHTLKLGLKRFANPLRGVPYFVIEAAGTLTGSMAGLKLLMKHRCDPILHDAHAQRIRANLQKVVEEGR